MDHIASLNRHIAEGTLIRGKWTGVVATGVNDAAAFESARAVAARAATEAALATTGAASVAAAAASRAAWGRITVALFNAIESEL
jgi:hypothetical protein